MVTRMNLLAATHRGLSGPPKRRVLGITLVETLTVITIVAILLTVGIPMFTYVSNANRMSSEVNGLLGDMMYARSEAIKEGQTVSICSSANPSAAAPTCSGSTTWQSGWIVFSDVNGNGAVSAGDTILRVQRQFSARDTFNASNGMSVVTFNREGFALGLANSVLVTLHAVVPNPSTTRCLAISIVGQLKIVGSGTGGCA
jgi:type IV fimbrial biogenesis protein FimT